VSVIFGDRQTEWDAGSLAMLRARHARPLPFPQGRREVPATALEDRRGRMEDFCWLREWGVPVPDAAARVGTSERRGYVYEERRLAGEISSDMDAEREAA
jgi:hypothetical protein